MNMIIRAAAAVAAVPAIAQASTVLPSEVDPIFAAIERHHLAMREVEAAESTVQRLYDLADETVGPACIGVLNMRDTDNGCHLIVDAYSVSEISDFTPGLDNQELRIFYINRFEQQQIERAAVIGDTEAFLAEPIDRLSDAEKAVFEVEPTSLPGLLALFAHIGKQVTANPYLFEERPDYVVLMAKLGNLASHFGKLAA
jgi:hypothetical protein